MNLSRQKTWWTGNDRRNEQILDRVDKWGNEDRLVIESRNHAAGCIRTSRGIPQSPTTIAIEELQLDGDRLHITHTYIDVEIFEEPLVLEYFFRRADDIELTIYDCTDANYEGFDELNGN